MSACDISVLICTWNRAGPLRETLRSVATGRAGQRFSWEVVVVDNNSHDETRLIVASLTSSYPVPLRYIFEPRQGRSHAMNAGIAATTSPVVAFTDDDVRVGAQWLVSGCAPLLEEDGVSYTGGPVRPIWERPGPTWFARSGRCLWGPLAILDYGGEPFIFEERRLVPLGVNFAVRRQLIQRIGGFNPELGRNAGSAQLLGQEVPEFFARSRAIGARGRYVPEMVVNHHVPAARLAPGYWRRWWYGKGISRARLERLHPITELGLDLRQVPTIAGVPRFLFGSAVRDAAAWLAALVTGNTAERVARETQLCYFVGQFEERRSWGSTVRTSDAAGYVPSQQAR